MPKIMLFCGINYEEFGGWNDFEDFFDTIEDAKKYLENRDPPCEDSWAHMVLDGEIILFGQSSKWNDSIKFWRWYKAL